MKHRTYEARLIERRLVVLARLKAKAVAICEETATALFDAIRAFNESRDIEEKIRLARVIEREQKKVTTWVERSNKAWEKRLEIDLEEQELRTRLWFLDRK